MSAEEWGADWLSRWLAADVPPARARTALVVLLDNYNDPIVRVAHYEPETGWRSICGTGPVTVTHWMPLPPLPTGVTPKWPRREQQYTVEQYTGDEARERKHAAESAK